jgi:ABC-type branched-subunit amino acid transport system ATPase component
MQESILEIQDVVKDSGGLRAVNHCYFEVQQGSITALIGPNGAGKTIKTEIKKRHLHCVNSQHIYYVFERFN